MIIKNTHRIRTFECPCGWKITHGFTRESELKITERLHAKVCPEATGRVDTNYTVENRVIKI